MSEQYFTKAKSHGTSSKKSGRGRPKGSKDKAPRGRKPGTAYDRALLLKACMEKNDPNFAFPASEYRVAEPVEQEETDTQFPKKSSRKRRMNQLYLPEGFVSGEDSSYEQEQEVERGLYKAAGRKQPRLLSHKLGSFSSSYEDKDEERREWATGSRGGQGCGADAAGGRGGGGQSMSGGQGYPFYALGGRLPSAFGYGAGPQQQPPQGPSGMIGGLTVQQQVMLMMMGGAPPPPPSSLMPAATRTMMMGGGLGPVAGEARSSMGGPLVMPPGMMMMMTGGARAGGGDMRGDMRGDIRGDMSGMHASQSCMMGGPVLYQGAPPSAAAGQADLSLQTERIKMLGLPQLGLSGSQHFVGAGLDLQMSSAMAQADLVGWQLLQKYELCSRSGPGLVPGRGLSPLVVGVRTSSLSSPESPLSDAATVEPASRGLKISDIL